MNADSEPPTPVSIDSDRLEASVFAKVFAKTPRRISVGRYRILDEVGAGGMGQVFSAYDEELDRKVAIKVVRGSYTSEHAGTRLRREAQALGRLTHPNVVAVHEIGEHNGQLFVAMEFVQGQTLRAWQTEHRGDVPAILDVYRQAARGLQAAHEAGVVHRDFKPDNALLGTDGRVRVVDFGLASPMEGDVRTPTLPPASTEHTLPVTETGAVLGTPSYMAPEQFAGDPTEPRTDQFAFCVALWEALFGERPFEGSSYAELAANVTCGARRPPPRDAPVPASIRAALDTGLATRPERRHADMAAIVATLDAELTPRRSRWWIGLAATSVVAISGFALVRQAPAARSLEDCPPAAERFAGIWDDEVRAALGSRFAASAERPYVAPTWTSLEREQDGLVADWTLSYEQACAATSSSDAATRRLAAQRLDCLDAAIPKLSLPSLLGTKEAAQRFAATYTGGAGGIREEATCRSDAFVRRVPPPASDAQRAERVLEIDAQLLTAAAMTMGGRPLDALPLIERAVEDARAVGYAPALAVALTKLADARIRLGHADAQETLDEALHTAEAAGHDRIIFRTLLMKAHASEGDARFELVDRADAIVARLGSPPDALAELAIARATALDNAGRADEAVALLQATADTQRHDDRVSVALRRVLYLRLAGLSGARDAPTLRLEAGRAAIEVVAAEVGAQHPATTAARDYAALALFRLGRYDESLAEYDQLVTIFEAVFPEGHPKLGWVLGQRGRVLEALGRIAESRRSFERGEAMLSRLVGPTHADVLRLSAFYLAVRALAEGDDPELRRRVQIYRGTTIEHPGVSLLSSALAALDGDAELARAELASAQAGLGKQPPQATWALRPLTAYILVLLGDETAALLEAAQLVEDPPQPDYGTHGATAMAGFIYASAGDYRAALPPLSRAVELAATVTPPTIAWYSPMAHYALAISLEETGGDHDRAVEAARTAVAQARVTGLPGLNIAENAATWLSEHAAPEAQSPAPEPDPSASVD